jgi:hypothetical protein
MRDPRAKARVGAVDRRQPPHAGARALPETNPGSEWPQPDSTGNSEEPQEKWEKLDRQRVGKATSGKMARWLAGAARTE